MHSDPIADMLTRIRNASRSRHTTVAMPHSKAKANLAEALKSEGFIADWRMTPGLHKGTGTLEVTLSYGAKREPVITGIKRLSSPGMRYYMGIGDVPKIQSGLGVVILSTSKGVMSDRQAKKNKVGGEALCSVW